MNILLALSLVAVAGMSSMAGMAVLGGGYVIWGLARAALRTRRAPSPIAREERQFIRLSLILFGAVLFSLIAARWFPVRLCQPNPEFSFWNEVRKFWYFLIPLLVAADVRTLSPKDRSRLVAVWVLSAVAVSIVGIQQYWTGWPRPQPIPYFQERFHATLFFGHHLSTTSILIFPFSVSLFSPGRWFKLAAAIIFVCLFFTYSRTLWIGLLVVLPLALLILRENRPSRAALIRSGFGMLVAVGVISLVPGVWGRLTNLQFGSEVRNFLWQIAWELFRERPLVGVGFQQFQPLSGIVQLCRGNLVWFTGHAHQLWLEALVSTGILGFSALVGWQVWLARTAWKASRDRKSTPIQRGFFVAWVVFLINGLTQVNFWEGKVLFQLMFALGLWMGLRKSIKQV